MKRQHLFAILVLIAASMASCGKDPEPIDPTNPTVNSITFGDNEGMKVVRFDNIQWDESYEDPFQAWFTGNFVVDGDEDCSFWLSSYATITYDDNTIDRCEISIGSDKLVFQYENILNKVYEHADTTILHTDSIPSIFIDDLLTCDKVDESDPLYQSYDITYPVTHKKNEALSLDDSFATSPIGNFSLYNSNDEPPTQMIETTEAVTFKHVVIAFEECYNAPIGEAFYMGFKYSKDSKDRLGWVKLIIEPNPSCIYMVRPLEAAIQE